jgi:hypothetical protein
VWEQDQACADGDAGCVASTFRAVQSVYSADVLPLLRDLGTLLAAATGISSQGFSKPVLHTSVATGPIDGLTLVCARLGTAFRKWRMTACCRVATEALLQVGAADQAAGLSSVWPEVARLRLLLLQGGPLTASALWGDAAGDTVAGSAQDGAPTLSSRQLEIMSGGSRLRGHAMPLLVVVQPAGPGEAQRHGRLFPTFVLEWPGDSEGGLQGESCTPEDSCALLEWGKGRAGRASIPTGDLVGDAEPTAPSGSTGAETAQGSSVSGVPSTALPLMSKGSIPAAASAGGVQCASHQLEDKLACGAGLGCRAVALEGASPQRSHKDASLNGQNCSHSTAAAAWDVTGGDGSSQRAAQPAPTDIPQQLGNCVSVGFWADACPELDAAVSALTVMMAAFMLYKVGKNGGLAGGGATQQNVVLLWVELCATLLVLVVGPCAVLAASSRLRPKVSGSLC